MESEMEVHSASESEEELVQKVSNFNIFQSSSEDESSGDESSEDKNSSGDDTSSPKDINHKVAKDVKVTKVENTEDELLNLAIKENVKWEKKHKSEVVDTTRFHLFKCGKSNLNAAKELKKMFGVRKSTKSKKRGFKKNTTIVTEGSEEWGKPPTFVGNGMRMKYASKPSGKHWQMGCEYFKIEYSAGYMEIMKKFEFVRETFDPNNVAMLVQQYPFFVEGLYQLFEITLQRGEIDTANELIKRCVYVYEHTWLERFNPWNGNCRMDVDSGRNKLFFKCMFAYMKQIGRRGCNTTAFHLCKLIWSLDPLRDPMGILFFIDYYAICIRDCQFVIDLYDSNTVVAPRLESANSTTSTIGGIINNMQTKERYVSNLPGLRFTIVLAWFWNKNLEKAKEHLTAALSNFPSFLKPLLLKCNVSITSGTWKSVLDQPIFANAKPLSSLGLEGHFLDLYLVRHSTLWKVDSVLNLLFDCATRLNTSIRVNLDRGPYQSPSPLEKYALLTANDLSDEVVTLPEDQPDVAQAIAQPAPAPGNLPADANPFLLLVQSLLPWNTVQGREHHE